MNATIMWTILSIVILGGVLFFSKKETNDQLNGQFFKHSTIFLIGYIIVHFQYYFDFLIGNISASNLIIWVNPAVVVKSMVLSSVGFFAFIIGYKHLKVGRQTQKPSTNRSIQGVTILLVLAAISLVVYYSFLNPLYLAGYYGQVSRGVVSTYSSLIFNILIYAILIQKSRNMVGGKYILKTFTQYVRQMGVSLHLLIAAYLVSVILSGDRGPIITLSIAYFFGYLFVTKRKLSRLTYALIFFGGAFFITLLGIARTLDKSMSFNERLRSSANTFDQYYHVESVVPQTVELAGSVRTLHAVVDHVPEKHKHTYGRFQLQQLLSSLPFANIFIANVFEDNHYRYRSPASFATWAIQGDYPTSGAGTTCAADLYTEFGLFGVILGMMLLGGFLRFAEVQSFQEVLPSLIVHSFILVYISDAIYISRSSILFGFRIAIWVWIALLVNKHVFNRA